MFMLLPWNNNICILFISYGVALSSHSIKGVTWCDDYLLGLQCGWSKVSATIILSAIHSTSTREEMFLCLKLQCIMTEILLKFNVLLFLLCWKSRKGNGIYIEHVSLGLYEIEM